MAAVVLGGVHAGVGKSVLANGIAAALRSQGHKVSSYAIGPGLPHCAPEFSSSFGKLPQQPAGLDGWLLTADAARAAFHSLSAGSDISIIEGCLGMFDSPSADGSEQGSTAQITQWLQVPVVLVIDTQAFNSVRGIVALIKGYTAVEGGLSIAGVILNKTSSKMLPGELAEGLKHAGLDVAVLGGMPKLQELSGQPQQQHQLGRPWSPDSTASTNCSSCSAGSQCQEPACCTQQLTELVLQHINLQQLQLVAAKAAVPRPQLPLPPAVRTFRVSMGVAHDEAMFQYFQQNLHMLGAAGVQLVPFSPLHDTQLPPGLSAVLLGGGAVADWADHLAANKPMLAALRAFAAAGGLVVGEGAALMYLSQSVQRPGRQRHSMVRLLPFHTQVQQQDASQPLGYVTVNVQQSTHPLLLPGSQLKGLASCCCHVVEERVVGGLSAALVAAAAGAAEQQQQVAGAADDAALLGRKQVAGSSSAAREGPAAAPAVAQVATPVVHSYSCMPLCHSGSAADVLAVEEGYTCGTVLGSCVQVHYGSCPDVVPHMVQRCLRVDVASVTAAASQAAAQAAEQAAVAEHSALQPALQLVPGSPGANALLQQQQQQALPIQGGRAQSAPDLQRVAWQQYNGTAELAAGAAAAMPACTSSVADSWMTASPRAAAHMQGSPSCKKSASIPASMYQLGSTANQHQCTSQPVYTQCGAPCSSASLPQLSQQQQQQQQQGGGQRQQQSSHGWHPLPLHVPKRWSLELQRLGSFTSQLLPGAKSPTGQEQQQQQQHLLQQQQGRGHHSRSSSHSMVHLPEEAPLSDAAIKVLDSSLPRLLGRTHQTHIGLAVPLSSAALGSAAVSTTGSFAAGTFGAASAPGSFMQRLDSGTMSKSSSVHEQMSQLAASLAQQDDAAAGGVHDPSATPSLCDELTVCPERESSSCTACAEQLQHKAGCGAGSTAGWLPGQQLHGSMDQPAGLPHHYQPHLAQQYKPPGQRWSMDQPSLFGTPMLQQQQLPPAAAGSRLSFDSTMFPPAGLARIQQQLCAPEELAHRGGLPSEELSFRGMLAQGLQHGNATPAGSTDNLLAAGNGLMSKSNSSSRLAAESAAATKPGSGSIISLSPAATDCLIALGLTSRLSGITEACRLGQRSSSSTGCPLAPLLDSIGASWAKEAAADAAAAGVGSNSSNGGSSSSSVPIVCRLVDGPDGLPRYKLDEDHIRRVQPSLVVVACEENSGQESHVQHHQQLQPGKASPWGARGPAAAAAAAAPGCGGSGSGAASWSWPIGPAGLVSSTMNGAVAVPGRVRLEVAVVQRVLQRAGVLWPEQRAVVLYQRCHSMSEVLEFILVLANAAGVPERGVQLVAGLRARLRAAAGRLCSGSMNFSMNATSPTAWRGSFSSSSSYSIDTTAVPGGVSGGSCIKGGVSVVMVLESVSPVRLCGFWVPEMLELVGAQQAAVCPAAAEPPSTVSWAQLRAAAPAVLILAMPGLDAGQAALHTEQLAGQPGFWSLPAVRSGAVYVVDHTLLCRPGPGLVLGVELLGHLVAPERQPLPVGLPMGSVLKLTLHSGQRCRPRLVPNYLSRYC